MTFPGKFTSYRHGEAETRPVFKIIIKKRSTNLSTKGGQTGPIPLPWRNEDILSPSVGAFAWLLSEAYW
jgi:hypothetical protein